MAPRRNRKRGVATSAVGGGGRRGGATVNNNNQNIGGIEENTMSMLDSSGFSNSLSSNNQQYLVDDRLAFLEAVRSASLVPENGIAPTSKMYEAIVNILKDETSLDLIMASYHLLNELEMRFPRVYLSKVENSNSFDLVVIEEAFSPFNKEEANKDSSSFIDPLGFHSLIEEVAKVANKNNLEVLGTKSLRDMLLLQYLVKVIENDHLPRYTVSKENMNWDLLRGSLLNVFLSSRKIIYKGLIKDYISIMCVLSESQTELREYSDTAVSLAFPEIERSTCASLKKLLLMIMELDTSRNVADQQGRTSRSDGVRTSAIDIILDELTYNQNLLSPFFQVFDEQDYKLKLIVEYFQKYTPKSSARTRKTNATHDNSTFDGILKYLLNKASAKNMIKKLGGGVVQLLLAHAFQAYVSLSLKDSGGKDSSLMEICKNTISAITCLKKEDGEVELLPLSKEVLFSAAMLISSLN